MAGEADKNGSGKAGYFQDNFEKVRISLSYKAPEIMR